MTSLVERSLANGKFTPIKGMAGLLSILNEHLSKDEIQYKKLYRMSYRVKPNFTPEQQTERLKYYRQYYIEHREKIIQQCSENQKQKKLIANQTRIPKKRGRPRKYNLDI